MSEKDLLRQCIEILNIFKSTGRIFWWRDNLSIYNKGGFPDLIIWWKLEAHMVNWNTLMVELKIKKGKLRPAQMIWRDIFPAIGDPCHHVVRSIDEFAVLMNERGFPVEL